MPVQLFVFFSQFFWVLIILVVLANAAIWRAGARHRINADPSLRRPLNRLYGGFVVWASLPFLLMGAGILAGSVDSVFQYLAIDTGNAFILAVHALMIAEELLFTYWVFFRGGDRLLALHTEIVQARPSFRKAMRAVALTLPLLHGATLYYATSSPHFGQFLGAKGATPHHLLISGQ